jgi:hypothetical protein
VAISHFDEVALVTLANGISQYHLGCATAADGTWHVSATNIVQPRSDRDLFSYAS